MILHFAREENAMILPVAIRRIVRIFSFLPRLLSLCTYMVKYISHRLLAQTHSHIARLSRRAERSLIDSWIENVCLNFA